MADSRQSHHVAATHCHRRQALHTNTSPTSRLLPALRPLLSARAIMDISSVFAAMQQHEQLAAMPFLDLMAFLRCASLLKDDILQPQPHTISVLIAPEILPPSINEFLAERFVISEDAVDVLWDILKDLVWILPTAGEAADDDEETFKLYGHKRGISKSIIRSMLP